MVWLVALLTTTTGHHLRDGLALAASAVACGVLALRRRWPYAVLLVSAVGAEGYLARVDGRGTLVLAAPLIALHTVAESAPRKRSLLVAGALVLLVGASHTLVEAGHWIGPENVALAALGGLAVEALTNVRKHAGAVPVTVTLRRERSELIVEVANDGPVIPPVSPGHGLIGMAERVAAVGGTLRTGPRVEGGFGVEARIPA